MGVIVKRPVRFTVIVTDQFKEQRIVEIRAALGKLDAVAKRIASRMGGSDRPEPAVAERLAAESRRNERAKLALRQELERVVALKIGDRYDRGTLEGMVEIDVGDDISRVAECEITVRDGKIVEIRDGACQKPSETSSQAR